jgi:DNA-binding response OmpR family regulator
MDKAKSGSSTQAGARVLVVDDERDIAQMVSTYVGNAGYDVSEAYTGPDAVSLARQLDPDVIVLDLGLPGLDGVEVCRQVRAFSDCYILMLTARGDEISRVVGLSVGADDYITKPFSARELLARVQRSCAVRGAAASNLVRARSRSPRACSETSRSIRPAVR